MYWFHRDRCVFINGIVIKLLNINKHKEWGEVLFNYEGFVVR